MDKLVHWEIPSTDVKKSADFYAQLFGWKMRQLDPTYVLFEVDDGVGGGIMEVHEAPRLGIAVYVGVVDIPTALKKAEALGAKVERPKTEIGGGMGFYAYLNDPCGCRVGVWSKQ